MPDSEASDAEAPVLESASPVEEGIIEILDMFIQDSEQIQNQVNQVNDELIALAETVSRYDMQSVVANPNQLKNLLGNMASDFSNTRLAIEAPTSYLVEKVTEMVDKLLSYSRIVAEDYDKLGDDAVSYNIDEHIVSFETSLRVAVSNVNELSSVFSSIPRLHGGLSLQARKLQETLGKFEAAALMGISRIEEWRRGS